MSTDERLGRIEERLELLSAALLGNGQPGKCSVNEGRISKLERASSYFRGLLAALALLTPIAGALIAKALEK